MVSVTEMHVNYHNKQQCTWCMGVDLVGFRDKPFFILIWGYANLEDTRTVSLNAF